MATNKRNINRWVFKIDLEDVQDENVNWDRNGGCILCGKEIKKEKFCVHLLDSLELVSSDQDFEDSQGFFPVGSCCKGKLPNNFIFEVELASPVATPVETAAVATPVQPVATAPECTPKTAPVAKPNLVMASAIIAQEVSTSIQPAVSMKRLTNTHYYSPSEMVTKKEFDLEDAPGEFLAEVRDYFGEGAYRVKYVAPVITDIGKDYDGDDVFYQVLVVCISGDQFMMTKPKWQTNWQVMPFHGEIKVGNYLLDIPVETATQEFMPEEPVTEVLSLGVIEVRFSRSSALFPKCTRPDDIEAVILLLSEKNDDELSTTTLHFHGNTYSFVELPHQNNGFGTVLAVPYGSDHGRWVITLLRGKDGNYNLHQNDFLVHAEEMNHRHTESL